MEMEVNNPKEEEEEEEDGTGATTVTVALHIGLPSPSAAEMASVLSSNSSEVTGKEHGGGDGGSEDSGFMGNRLNKGQYWIPTPSQILIGPTQFSCPVCCKTFNRYNNMQVIEVVNFFIVYVTWKKKLKALYLLLLFYVYSLSPIIIIFFFTFCFPIQGKKNEFPLLLAPLSVYELFFPDLNL